MSRTIDTDVHCAPASFDALRPYLSAYWIDYVEGANLAISPTQGGAYPAAVATPPDDVGALRKEVLDDADLELAVLSCTTAFDVSRNPYFEAEMARAINNWVRDEWLDVEPRLRGSIVVPTLDPRAAAEEIERLGTDRRFAQVLLPVRGHDVRYGNKHFAPIFEAATAHDLVVTLHAWGRVGSSPTTTGFTATYVEDYLANAHVAQGQLVGMISEGLFERLPSLRVCVAECGFSWLPALLWRFDKEWKGVWREVPWVKERPTEYVRRHVRFTSQPAQLPHDPAEAAAAVEVIGAKNLVMYASDHPHDHGGGGERLLAALDDDGRDAVRYRNAAELYRAR